MEVGVKYITMICDIKNSRKIYNREQLQYTLIEAIGICNIRFKQDIISPFLITLGDEWQGLLRESANYFEIIDFYKKSLPSTVSFYTGIGIGPVTIHNFKLTVNQLDGPAFYLAREAINYAKKEKHSIVVLS